MVGTGGRVLVIRISLVIAMLLTGAVMTTSSHPSVAAKSLSPADQATALLEQAHARQIPEVRPGQVLHITTRGYERHDTTIIAGPLHLAPTFLAPDITLTEIWAVADDMGYIARVVTYVRDEAGELIEMNVIDEKAQLIAYSPRHGETIMSSFRERGLIADVGGRVANLANTPLAQFARPLRVQLVNGRPAVVLEYLTEADPTWLSMVRTGELTNPYAGDLPIRDQGRRLIFDRDTNGLLREEDFVVGAQGEEFLLRSTEWLQIEVLDSGQILAGILNPAIPSPEKGWTSVPLSQMAVQQAKAHLPFALFTASKSSDNNTSALVTYGTGLQQEITDIPLRFRGLDFAVQRGEAARISYGDATRHLDLIQGTSTQFESSLQKTPAFWTSARAITVDIEGTAIPGWLLFSAPSSVTKDPTTREIQQVPGVTWLLIPDVQGTGVIMMAQGYSDAELVAFATGLKRVR